MSLMDQNLLLPHRNSNGRFTSISRHNVGEITCAADRPGFTSVIIVLSDF